MKAFLLESRNLSFLLVVVVHSSISLQMCTLSYAIALLLKKYEHVVVVGVMKYTKKISMNDMMVMLLSCSAIFYYYYLLIEEKKKEGKFTNPTTSSYYSYYNNYIIDCHHFTTSECDGLPMRRLALRYREQNPTFFSKLQVGLALALTMYPNTHPMQGPKRKRNDQGSPTVKINRSGSILIKWTTKIPLECQVMVKT